MITFQEFMLTSKHFCLIRSDIPFRLICNPNGGDWLSGTDICNLPAGSFTFDFWKLLPEKYFKNNPAFKLGLAYDSDMLIDGRKIDVSYSDLDYGTGVAGLAGSQESTLHEILIIDSLISENLIAALQKLENINVSLVGISKKIFSDSLEWKWYDVEGGSEGAGFVNNSKINLVILDSSNNPISIVSGHTFLANRIRYYILDNIVMINNIKVFGFLEMFGQISYLKYDNGILNSEFFPSGTTECFLFLSA